MTTKIFAALAAVGLSLSASVALAASNSPQGDVVPDSFTFDREARFLSGNSQVSAADFMSSNAVDARTRQAVQQGRNWPGGSVVAGPPQFIIGTPQNDPRDFMSSNAYGSRTRAAVQRGRNF